jgi:lipopolysaccharide/colanic/teichoic acid biosynthesis glycosyltransferase
MTPPRSRLRAARTLVMLAGDVAIACVSLALVVWMRRNIDIPWTRTVLSPEKLPLTLRNIAVFASSFVVALSVSGFHNPTESRRHRPSLLVALPLQVAILGVAGALTEHPWPRSVLIGAPLVEAAALKIARLLLNRFWTFRWPGVVLVGTAPYLESFIADVADRRLNIEAIVSFDQPVAHPAYAGILGSDAAAAAIRAGEELIDVGGDRGEGRLALLNIRGARGFLFVPSPDDVVLAAHPFGTIGDRLLAEVRLRAAYGFGERTKRSFDIIFGGLVTVLTSPLLMIISLMILIESGWPVLFRQPRLGRNGRPFDLWKFRSMRHVAGATEPFRLTTEEDERATALGLWLRRYRLDELPQLYNVLAGEMSLVGPRPETPELSQAISERLPSFPLRLLARPGLAGLAQVSGEYDQTASAKLLYDLQYLSSWSLLLDIRILLQAVSTSLSGRGM